MELSNATSETPKNIGNFFARHKATRRFTALVASMAVLSPAIDYFTNIDGSEPLRPTPCEALPSKKSDNAVAGLILKAKHVTSSPEDYSHYYYSTWPNASKKASNLLKQPSSTPKQVNAYLLKADKLLKNYGVKFETADKLTLESKEQSLTQKALKKSIGRQAVADIVKGISLLPKEYVAASGLKKIRLIARDTSTPGKARDPSLAYVYPEIENLRDTVFYKIDKKGNYTVIAHELAHLVDAKECLPGDIVQDDQYGARNPKNLYGKSNSKGKYVLAENYKKIYQLKERLRYYSSHGLKSKYCVAKQKLARVMKKQSVISYYSLTNLSEDKAELGGEITLPWNFGLLVDKGAPRIRAKTMLLLRRLYDLSPVSARKLIGRASFENAVTPSENSYDCASK